MQDPEHTHAAGQFDLDAFLPYQLAVAAERVSRDFARLYSKRFGISIAEWRLLAHLGQSGPMSIREIHERAGMEKSRISRAASRLETQGRITKKADPQDRRLVELDLTPAGRALLDEIVPVARAFEAQLADRLGPGADAFTTGLAVLAFAR